MMEASREISLRFTAGKHQELATTCQGLRGFVLVVEVI